MGNFDLSIMSSPSLTHSVRSYVNIQVAISTFTDAITINRLERNLVRLDCKETHPWTFLRDIAKPFVEDAKKKRIEYGMNCEHYESTLTPF